MKIKELFCWHKWYYTSGRLVEYRDLIVVFGYKICKKCKKEKTMVYTGKKL